MTAIADLHAAAALLDETGIDPTPIRVTFYDDGLGLLITASLTDAQLLAAHIGAELAQEFLDIPGNHWSSFEGRLDGSRVEIRGSHEGNDL